MIIKSSIPDLSQNATGRNLHQQSKTKEIMTDINENKTQRYYITKYALTMGIVRKEMRTTSTKGYVMCPRKQGMSSYYKVRKDCFFKKNKAIAKVEQMRHNVIDTTNRTLQRLQKMTNHREIRED